MKRSTVGERSADVMRNAMGSWGFIAGSLVLIALWMVWNAYAYVFDPAPYIGLNLLLSVVAALQGAVLLISAKRADGVIATLAAQDAAVNLEAERRIEALQVAIARIENIKHNEILREIAELREMIRG